MTNQKCAFIAILGPTNAGKSTLVNNLVGTKVSIVSPKVQTTRASIKGIAMEGDAQLVFIDTPGIFSPKRTLEKAIVQEAWRRIAEADFLALMIDVKRGICPDVKAIINSLKQQDKKAVLILNKIDTVNRESLLSIAAELNDTGLFNETFMISALKGDGVEKLRRYFAQIAPKGQWAFPEDQIMDCPVKFFAAEVTREKIFMKLQQELPYSIAVETESWEEKENSITVRQVIYAQKDGQKGILLGKGGSMIKQIGEASRCELEEALEKKINLFLFIKVRENWVDNPSIYKELGLDLPEV